MSLPWEKRAPEGKRKHGVATGCFSDFWRLVVDEIGFGFFCISRISPGKRMPSQHFYASNKLSALDFQLFGQAGKYFPIVNGYEFIAKPGDSNFWP